MEKKELIRRLHAVFREKGISEENKRDIYASYGVESSTELAPGQIIGLINRLRGEFIPHEDRTRRALISNILSVLSRLGVREDENGRTPADRWRPINEFVRKHNGGKVLCRMELPELKKFHVQVRAMEYSGWRRRPVDARGETEDQTQGNSVHSVIIRRDAPIS